MKIAELFNDQKPVVSFEVFPPKPDVPLDTIYENLEKFKGMNPDFISVTYGAGGSHKERTVEIASKTKNEYGMESMAHFTCIGHTVEEIDAMLDSLEENNIENILALRGDPPLNQPDFSINRNAYNYANELIAHISRRKKFCIAAAAYMEGHADSKRLKDDMNYLKLKVEAGADFLVTQLFFDNRLYYNFMDRLAAMNITRPVMCGIMPIFKADQIKRITSLCGASIPAKLVVLMDKYADNPDDMRKVGIEYASMQIRDLIGNGVAGIHIYTMNRPKSTLEILQNAGLERIPQNAL